MSRSRKVLVVVVLVVSMVSLLTYAAEAKHNSDASRYYRCQRVWCAAYNANGTPRYNKIYGVRYRSGVCYQAQVYGVKGPYWLTQTMFRSQSILYKSADFK